MAIVISDRGNILADIFAKSEPDRRLLEMSEKRGGLTTPMMKASPILQVLFWNFVIDHRHNTKPCSYSPNHSLQSAFLSARLAYELRASGQGYSSNPPLARDSHFHRVGSLFSAHLA